MKRGRKTDKATPAPSAALAPPVRDVVRAKLEQDYAAFVTGTATEDPKQFVARIAAAREAYEHLRQIGETGPEDAPREPTEAEVLAEARAGLADENKT